MRIRSLLLLGALLAAGPASLAAQRTDDQIERPEVGKLVFKGVKSVDKDLLKESVATEPSRCRSLLFAWICPWYKGDAVYFHSYLDETEFQRDVLRIRVAYWLRGWRDVQVDTTVSSRKKDRVTVTFRVAEGPPTLVQKVEVERPASLLDERALKRLVLVRAGRAFNTLQLDSTLVRLRQAMWARGYADAEVTHALTVDTAARRVGVAIVVTPNARTTVGEVRVHGQKDVAEQSIRNSLLIEEGDVFRLADLTSSQRALYESGLFRRAALYVTSGDSSDVCTRGFFDEAKGASDDTTARIDSVKRIEVCVQEGPLRDVRASAGFNTVDFFQLESRFSHSNFLGGARRLDIQGRLGNLGAGQLNDKGIFRRVTIAEGSDRAKFLAPTWQVSADVRQRWFRSPRNTLGAGVFAHRRSAPGIFIDRGYGTSLAFTRLVRPRAPLSANYRYEITTVDAGDVYFCINYGVCDRSTISALQQTQRLSPFILSATPDRSNDPFSPTSGWRGQFALEHASAATLSSFRYNRAFAEAAVYRRVGGRGTLASHLRVGWVQALASTAEATGLDRASGGDVLHPRKRFYAGGAQSVRGFGENQLGPRVLTIPAEVLRGKENSRCDAAEIRFCNPNDSVTTTTDGQSARNSLYSERDFNPRPLGGSRLLEGSVEFRFPIRGAFIGAAFVDGAVVRGKALGGESRGDAAVTPGIGVRYKSPVGPIRVDIGYNPLLVENLPVITEDLSGSTRRLVQLVDATGRPRTREFDPNRNAGRFTSLLNHLTLHLSIGEAF